jgi:tetratricopeptide (TPR) repeat protein
MSEHHELNSADYHLSLGLKFAEAGLIDDAEASYRRAITLDAQYANAHKHLALTKRHQGDMQAAISEFRIALRLDPEDKSTRRELATTLVSSGRTDESFALFYEELSNDPDSGAWLRDLSWQAIASNNWALAGEYASILAKLRWGSQWYPKTDAILPVRPEFRTLTIPKLQHDVEQFDYLLSNNHIGKEFRDVARDYQRIIDDLSCISHDVRIPIEDHEHALKTIGHVYNRIVHVRPTPRVPGALSDHWESKAVEDAFFQSASGITVVDNFLSGNALQNLRLFCLESTVWLNNRYKGGRLGAFFNEGFNCPLLLQIAEELRVKLQRIIGKRHPLRQLWAFKLGDNNSGRGSTHADFASVNVNFWITPDEANLDEDSGGLLIYNTEAPIDWEFDTYNNKPDFIERFLNNQDATTISIPYRQNRAVIFNSDLFHGTAPVQFRSGFENRRINITMLYGNRQNDIHHARREKSGSVQGGALEGSAWRSAAFNRLSRSRL